MTTTMTAVAATTNSRDEHRDGFDDVTLTLFRPLSFQEEHLYEQPPRSAVSMDADNLYEHSYSSEAILHDLLVDTSISTSSSAMTSTSPSVITPEKGDEEEGSFTLSHRIKRTSSRNSKRKNGRKKPSAGSSLSSLHSSSSPSTITSIIVVGDEGAEVTADFLDKNNETSSTSSSAFRTPRKLALPARAIYSSLLDDEKSTGCTPTPPTKSAKAAVTPSSAETTDLCCVGYPFGCLRQRSDDTAEHAEVAVVQDKIACFLSSDPLGDFTIYRSWQAWSTTNKCRNEDIQQVLKNRVFNLSARKRRLETLRKDMSPFSPATPTRNGLVLGRAKSFDITRHAPAVVRGSKAGKSGFASFLESVRSGCNAGRRVSESPAVIRSRVLDAVHEDICYDSDPEDCLRRPQRSPAHALARTSSTSSDKENVYAPLSAFPRRLDPDSDDAIKHLVQEFMNEKLTLILHERGPTEKSFSPRGVHAWFERGQHLGCNTVIQPRFMWKSVHKTKPEKNNLSLSSFDIIDVSRVLAVDRVDRVLYPFAKPLNCFLIKTMENSLLFETKSVKERERLVRLMKLLVARLGSKLIVGDPSFVTEFFVTLDDIGPGEAPYWLR